MCILTTSNSSREGYQVNKLYSWSFTLVAFWRFGVQILSTNYKDFRVQQKYIQGSNNNKEKIEIQFVTKFGFSDLPVVNPLPKQINKRSLKR